MKILVTGHKGYIGSKLFAKLQSLDHDVFGVDLKEGEDLCDYNYNENIDYIFHLAALPRVGYSVENPAYTLKHNVLATSKVLELAKKCNVKRVIFSSSSAIYGNYGKPESPYGLHKLMSEQECDLYSRLYGVDTVCLRYFNLFSEDQEFGGAYSTVICAWLAMLKKNLPLRIDGDGTQARDFIHVDDVVSANIFCMYHKENFNAKCFDIGLGKSISLNQIKNIVEKYQNYVKWNFAPERIGDVKVTLAELSKGLQTLGWVPEIDPITEFNKYFSNNFKL